MNGWTIVRLSVLAPIVLLLTACVANDRAPVETSDAGTSSAARSIDDILAVGGPLETTHPLAPGSAAPAGEVLSSNLTNTNSAATMHDFLVSVLSDIDRYWSGIWANAGYPAPFVSYAFPAPGEQLAVPTDCTADGSGLTDDTTARYCTGDDFIIVSQQFAVDVWNGTVEANADPNDVYSTGDFSVAYVLAHEYAHSLQAELGMIGAYPVYKTELHADCWAGIWANSAYYQGALEAGDVEEAFQTTLDIGDYGYSDPSHHGTPEQRSSAFMAGYNSGVPASCDPLLTSTY